MGAAVSLVAAGVGLYSNYKAGKDAKSAGKANANLANAKASRESEVTQKQVDKLLSRQKALYAKANVDMSSGSPLLVMLESAREGKEEVDYISQTGEATASLMKKEGQSAQYQAWAGGASKAISFLGGLM